MPIDKTKRICLWSGPRNISTALMYSFAQRADTQVFDEPLYGHYLNQTDAKKYHPGAKETMEDMECDGKKVIEIMLGKHDKPVVFFKHMTHHLHDVDLSFLEKTINIILTRNPVEMLPSFAKVIDQPSMADVGYARHIELLNYLREINHEPIVLDSKYILLNPKKTLTQLCNLLEIPFDKNMLEWKPGPRPEDGTWP